MAYLAYKFRLNPTPAQERALGEQLETLRRVYNAALQYRCDFYEANKKAPTGIQVYRVFAARRNAEIADLKAGGTGPHWLTRISSVAMRDTLARVEKAYKRFFARIKRKGEKPGHPRFKRRGQHRSIPFNNCRGYDGCELRGPNGKPLLADIPTSKSAYHLKMFGVGKIRVVVHRPVAGRVKTVCVDRDSDGKWYVVLVAERPDGVISPKDSPAVGIDVGLEHFLTDSDGRHEPNPRFLKAELPRLRRLQRSASRKAEAAKKRKQKFRECRNLQKAYRKVAKLHARVRRLRKEHHYQVANRLIDRAGTICVESLNVQGMLKNGKLSRAISDAGWAGFLGVLRHKAARAGVRFVEVDPRGTSQACPECGGEVRKDLKVRVHACPRCGYTAQRDHAAARVILARGLGGGGSPPVGGNVAGRGERSRRRTTSATDPVGSTGWGQATSCVSTPLPTPPPPA